MALADVQYDRSIAGPSIAELVAMAAEGDEQAWESLVADLSPLVWTVANSFRLDEATTRDVCQTVWVHLIESIGDIRRADRIEAWLVTTCKREALRVKRAQSQLDWLDLDDFPSDAPDVDVEMILEEERRHVADAFRRLSARCREILGLFAINPPLRYSEVADVLGMAIGSVGPSRQRCLRLLRSELRTSL